MAVTTTPRRKDPNPIWRDRKKRLSLTQTPPAPNRVAGCPCRNFFFVFLHFDRRTDRQIEMCCVLCASVCVCSWVAQVVDSGHK